MDTVRILLRVLEERKYISPAYQFIEFHMIFNVEIEDFWRKAQYAAGGHIAETILELSYARVALR